MNTTALNRSSIPQQPEKIPKTNASKAMEEGAESILFSGMLQQCLVEQHQDQKSGNLYPTEEQQLLADGSQSAGGIKGSTSVRYLMQTGQQIGSSPLDSLENITLAQTSMGTSVTTTSENAVKAQPGPGTFSEISIQNLPGTPEQLQWTEQTELHVPVKASAINSQVEVVQEQLNHAGNPQNAEDGAMTEVLKATETLTETAGLDQHLNSKAVKSQINSRERLTSETEQSQKDNLTWTLKSNTDESTGDSSEHMNHKHRSEKTVTYQITGEGIRIDNDAQSKQKLSFGHSIPEVMGSQPPHLSTSEGTTLSPQLPKSASVPELPVIWTQHAQLLRSGETKILKMLLNPEQLGALEIELSLKNGILSGVVSVETELAHELIQKQLPHFLSTLDSKQIAAGTFEMHYRGENGGFSDPSWKDRRNGSASQNNANAVPEMDQGLQKPQETSLHNHKHKRLDILA